MNKTLKFLLAIALFVAILAIATGVNAAVDGTAGNEYANLATAATAEKNVAEATQKIKQEGNMQTKQIQQELDEVTDRYKRILAEFENHKKRSQKEKESIYGMITGDVVSSMLPVKLLIY